MLKSNEIKEVNIKITVRFFLCYKVGKDEKKLCCDDGREKKISCTTSN